MRIGSVDLIRFWNRIRSVSQLLIALYLNDLPESRVFAGLCSCLQYSLATLNFSTHLTRKFLSAHFFYHTSDLRIRFNVLLELSLITV